MVHTRREKETQHIAILNHHDKISPRIQHHIDSLRSAGYRVEIISWDRHPTQYGKTGKDALLRLPMIYWKLGRQISACDFDAIHCTHLALLPLAVGVGKMRRAFIVFDDYDHFSLMLKERMPRYAKWLAYVAGSISKLLAHFVDLVFVIDTHNDTLANHYMPFAPKVIPLRNVPSLASGISSKRAAVMSEQAGQVSSHRLVYVGNIKRDKCVTEMIQAFQKVAASRPNARFTLVGEQKDNSVRQLQSLMKIHEQANNVEFTGPLPYHDMMQFVTNAAIGLALYRPHERYLLARGNSRKLFTYMSAGIPIIASDFPGIGSIIKSSKCGLLVNPLDIEEISQAILYLLDHPEIAREMGRNGLQKVLEECNWETEQEKFLEAYAGLHH